MKERLQGRGKGKGKIKHLEKHVYLNYTFRCEITFGFIPTLLYEEQNLKQNKKVQSFMIICN